jgi:glycosyltransferase 2 family protein
VAWSPEKASAQPLLRRRLVGPAAVVGTFAVSLTFGYLAVHGIRIHATSRAIRSSSYWWLAPSLAALALSILLRVIRWRTLFRPERRPPLRDLAKATLVGYLFNSILPARAGEAARIVALKYYSGTPAAETTATVVVERIIDVSSLMMLLFVLLPWLPPISWLAPAVLVAFACVIAIVALALFARHASRVPIPWALRWLSTLPGLRDETVDRMAANVVSGLATLERPRQALAVVAWTFLSWLVLGVSFWLLMLGFHLKLSFVAGLFVVIATGFAFIIPAAPSAIGVFEAAGIAVMKAYDVDASEGFGYVLVLHALNLFPFLVAGSVVLGVDARRRRSG